MKFLAIFISFFMAIVVVQISNAEAKSPQERASELVQWRENCNDPDPDLRLAYIESAIADGDVSIRRICTRSALESDNSDIRNLGLRAAIASLKQITFSVEMPKELESALNKAAKDKDALNKVYDSKLYKAYERLRNGLPMIITETTISSSSSVWFPLLATSGKDNSYKGGATISGDTISWVGSVRMPSGVADKGSINLKLESGGELKGFFQPTDLYLFPISAKLW